MLTPEITRRPVLVVGCGSIGRRHIRNLKSLGMDQVWAYDPDPDRLSYVVSEYGVTGYPGFEEVLDASPEAVLICTPPTLHVSQALEAIRSHAHLFVEKPLSHSLDNVDELIQEAAAQNLVAQVGYNLRFHPGMDKLRTLLDEGVIGRVLWVRAEFGQYLPDWRPWQDYRQSYTAQRSMGGGIILDSSHEIDYLCCLLGPVAQVYCMADVLSDLEVDAEDTATMLLRFAGGAMGEVHLDFVQRSRARNCKIVGTEGTITWDYLAGSLQVNVAGVDEPQCFDTSCDPNDMYLKEMESFLGCVYEGRSPVVDLASARKVLEVALAAHESARSQCAVNLPEMDGKRR